MEIKLDNSSVLIGVGFLLLVELAVYGILKLVGR